MENVLLLFAVPTDTDIVSRSLSLPHVLPCSLALVCLVLFSPVLLGFAGPAESGMLVIGFSTPAVDCTGAYWRHNKSEFTDLDRAGTLD